MSAPSRPESSARTSDRIVQELERDIVAGVLPDRSPLPPERDLMQRFGASRTVIREAIATLSNRGLIESRPRFRPIVRKPDYETVLNSAGEVLRLLLRDVAGVRNLYQSRVFIERALVREAALHGRKEDIEALSAALAANEAAIADSQRFYRTDIAFHGVLYQIPHNPIFTALHHGYASWLAPHWERMPRSPERNRVNFLAHRDIFRAIRDRDPDQAEEALSNHLNAAWEYVRGTFGTEMG
ncbi:MAG: FCD domain-containing protein [Alphaproteobacteria bacterium]|nr:MAG: FCD domain-containing protein [Alphaproteobacteria bacterium]